jgi:hypothetical protein
MILAVIYLKPNNGSLQIGLPGRVGGWMVVWMDGWVARWMYRWLDRWLDVRIDGWVV